MKRPNPPFEVQLVMIGALMLILAGITMVVSSCTPKSRASSQHAIEISAPTGHRCFAIVDDNAPSAVGGNCIKE